MREDPNVMTSFSLPNSLYEKLKEHCRTHPISASELIRQALRDKLNEVGK